MNRKKFIKTSLAISSPFLCLPAFSRSSFLSSLLRTQTHSDRVLILIQLFGGNDGLNTIIPLDQYKNLLKSRSNIMIPEAKVLRLPDTNITGLHPSMASLSDLYKDKKMMIIQGVGCPHPNYSHPVSLDAKMTACDDPIHPLSGWLGRYVNTRLPDFPKGYPNVDYPHPPIIRARTVSSKICIGTTDDVSVSINSIDDISLPAAEQNQGMQDLSGMNPGLSFVNYIGRQIETYAPVIKAAAARQPSLSKRYRPRNENTLSDQLQNVARLIGGGLQTKIYLVNLNGFDTHASQVDPTDACRGLHSDLLRKLSEAMAAFMDDLQLMGIADRVICMTYSDFGRRIASNNSYGTDHGTSEPVMIFGEGVKGGIVGKNPEIPTEVSGALNLDMNIDFRSVYSTVLKDWFGASDKDINASLLKTYAPLDIFKS